MGTRTKKKPKWTTLIIIDSQAVKNTCNASIESKGFCFYKSTLLDHGYHPENLIDKLEQVYPQMMTKIKFELSTKPSKQEKAAPGKLGFILAIALVGN